MTTTALALFSGGLDSILACRVLADQGVKVVALKFITPFFDYDLLGHEEDYQAEIKDKYNIDVDVVDLSLGYLDLLKNPAHGFGKNFNPCIDCKILMHKRAKELMPEYGASFLVTGEVLGQRPMSQRRDTLRVIERDAGCEAIVLRPLSARLCPATLAEMEGLVDRSRLHAISGRGRKEQIELARRYGITDYPNPAGGCILADVNLGSRIERYYAGEFSLGAQEARAVDIKLLISGRQFLLLGKYWFVLGRDEKENLHLEAVAEQDDWLFSMPVWSGPTGLLRRAESITDPVLRRQLIEAAAGLLVRYSKKLDGVPPAGDVLVEGDGLKEMCHSEPLADEIFLPWKIE